MMSDSLFQEMPIGMRLHYEQAARLDEAASASRKRKADVETLKAFADAMKEHGSTEQYITSQKAISALFKQTISDLGLDIGKAE